MQRCLTNGKNSAMIIDSFLQIHGNNRERGLCMIENTGIREEILWEIQKLAKDCGLKRVLLFGSRARGDYRKTSDIDLAVSGGDTVRFSLEAEEVISTLLFFDVVNLDGPVQKELLESIQREGKILYEEV